MRILWLVNVVIPEAGKVLNINYSVFGGWITGALSGIRSCVENITIASISSEVNTIRECEADNVRYVVFPDSDIKELRNIFSEYLKTHYFDIIHIYGTEMKHAAAMIDVASPEKIVINIQGLTWYYWQHYLEGVPYKNIKDNLLKKLIRILTHQRLIEAPADYGCGLMKRQGIRELEIIKKCKNVIGRTNWDRACVKQINPDIRYFHVNETLRDCFYTDRVWSPDICLRHSIFLSQAGSPIKGLHYFVSALEIIKKFFPDVHVYVGGNCPIRHNDAIRAFRDKYLGGYFGGINTFIDRHNLSACFTVCGFMNEEEMREQYLKANVFVCPSVIENSPNSVAEAMMLGTPVVASYVGGIPDMLINEKEGLLYQTSAPYMLADCVIRIFNDDDFALSLSKNAIMRSHITHDRQTNAKELLKVYNNLSLPAWLNEKSV